jgi:hypothetical protein
MFCLPIFYEVWVGGVVDALCWCFGVGRGKILVNAHVGVHMLAVGTMVRPIVSVGTI